MLNGLGQEIKLIVTVFVRNTVLQVKIGLNNDSIRIITKHKVSKNMTFNLLPIIFLLFF